MNPATLLRSHYFSGKFPPVRLAFAHLKSAALATEFNGQESESSRRENLAPKPLLDTRVIYCGDKLDHLRKMSDGCVDLIYIDPPFNSNRSYEVFWNENREIRSFEDRHESTQGYIDFMRPRCVELARVLKPTGTFYYHCDWHASHYVKVMLDQIFGEGGFINEIIWKRQSSHNDAKQRSGHLGRVHDTLLMYSKSNNYFFKQIYRPYDPAYVQDFYRHVEPAQGGVTNSGIWEFLGVLHHRRAIRTMSFLGSPSIGGTAKRTCRSCIRRAVSFKQNRVRSRV